jgi:hypothetical protein
MALALSPAFVTATSAVAVAAADLRVENQTTGWPDLDGRR